MDETKTIARKIREAPGWVPLTEAQSLLGVTRTSLYSWVKKGLCRVDKSGPVMLIFRDDLLDVHQQNNVADFFKYDDLVERGVFPPECQGLNGTELVQWAKEEGRKDLITPQPSVPPHLGPLADLAGTPSPTPVSTVEALSQKVEHLQAAVGTLMTTYGLGPGWGDFSDESCEALIKTCVDGLNADPTRGEVFRLNRILGKIEHRHLTRMGVWARQNPVESKALCGVSPPYKVVHELAYRLAKLGASYPGADLLGSLPNQLRVQTQRVYESVRSLCREQAATDLFLGQGACHPVGYSDTDRFILAQICPHVSLSADLLESENRLPTMQSQSRHKGT
jgi:hypothetical protein